MNAVAQKEDQAARPQCHATEREYISPEVNIFDTKDGYVLEAEMPGVAKEGVHLNLEDNVLTIEGERRGEEVSNVELVYRETRPADFRRLFQLDPTIETEKITAKIEQGILTVHLPKAEQVKPRKITVS